MAKLAKLATAVKAGDNELTLVNVDVVMKLRCSCQQLVTAVRAGNSF